MMPPGRQRTDARRRRGSITAGCDRMRHGMRWQASSCPDAARLTRDEALPASNRLLCWCRRESAGVADTGVPAGQRERCHPAGATTGRDAGGGAPSDISRRAITGRPPVEGVPSPSMCGSPLPGVPLPGLRIPVTRTDHPQCGDLSPYDRCAGNPLPPPRFPNGSPSQRPARRVSPTAPAVSPSWSARGARAGAPAAGARCGPGRVRSSPSAAARR